MHLQLIIGPNAILGSLGQHYTTLGHNFSVLTSAPVNICIMWRATGHHVW